MKKCKHCGDENPDDAEFCTGCGHRLAEAGGERSSDAGVREEEMSEPDPSAGVEEKKEETRSETMRIFLVLRNENSVEEKLDPEGEVILGREDFLNYIPREEAKYISRKHLKFVRAPDFPEKIKVEDMNSANGTSLNGEVLKPGTAYEIDEGDELDLADGSVVANFSLEEELATVDIKGSDETGEPEPVDSGREDQPRCPACGWYNPPGAKVCEKCGESL